MTVATYHNHTRWSDGKHTTSDVIDWAARLGVDELGISDHFVEHPQGRQYDWAMRAGGLPAYVDDIRSQGAAAPITVRLGLEIDWFPDHAAAIERAIAGHEFDFLVGSVHELDGVILDGSPAVWQRMSPTERDETFRQYWIQMRHLAESRLFDIAAHLDLPKKFDVAPTVAPQREIDAALDAIADAQMVVEINTAGWHKPCRDAYPTQSILEGCHARSIRVTISADAHQGDHLLRDFDRAAERLAAAGYTEIARFNNRHVTLEPLREAVQPFGG